MLGRVGLPETKIFFLGLTFATLNIRIMGKRLKDYAMNARALFGYRILFWAEKCRHSFEDDINASENAPIKSAMNNLNSSADC